MAPLEVVTRPARLVALSDARCEPARELGEFVPTSAGVIHAIIRGQGPDVVLLHGVTDNAHTWHDCQAALAGVARVHALDLPGHGLSDIPNESLSAREMAAWVAAYLDAAKIDRAVVVGWSLGGAVAVALAAESAPRVASVVLEAPAVLDFPFPFALWPLRVGGVAEIMHRLAARPGPRRFFMSQTFASGFKPTEEVVERYWRGWQVRGRARYIRALLREFEAVETIPMFSQMNVPLWVVHGDQDQLVPIRVGRELPNRYAKAELSVLTGVGHAPHVERPQAVLDAVRAALRAS